MWAVSSAKRLCSRPWVAWRGPIMLNHVSAISAVLGRVGRLVTELLIGAYLLCSLLCLFGAMVPVRDNGILPPLLAGVLALGLAGWLAGECEPVSMWRVLIVLGAGIHYAIDFAEDQRDGTLRFGAALRTEMILSFGSALAYHYSGLGGVWEYNYNRDNTCALSSRRWRHGRIKGEWAIFGEG